MSDRSLSDDHALRIATYCMQAKKSKEFKEITLYGILNNNSAIRKLFSSSIIKLCKICNLQCRYDFLSYILSFMFESFNQSERNSSELFEIISDLFQIYFFNIIEFDKSKLIII